MVGCLPQIAVYISLCVVIAATSTRADELDDARARLAGDYRARLAALATEVESQGDRKLAATIRNWLPRKNGGIVLFSPLDVPPDRAEGKSPGQFARLRNDRAKELFAIAGQAAEAGRPARALQLAVETIRENPNHEEARRVLGYESVDGRWLTSYAVRKTQAGYVWHHVFGWIKVRDVDRYESGERPRRGRWVSVEDDAATRRAIDDGWVARTAHFRVTTNHSLEEGVRLARQLETLHGLWRQLFAGYYLDQREVRQLFAGQRTARRQHKPYDVRYYRTRDEYNAALTRRQPRIGETLGIYFDRDRRAHFFAGADQHPATIFHEAIHQLFGESRPSVRNVGALDNFWIVEGMATYFESLELHASGARYYTLGGRTAGRLPAARERLLSGDNFIPLAELVRLGKDGFQRVENLRMLYSQIAGLTTFLMQAENGRYRDAVVDYLVAVYSGRARDNTLAKLTGKSYADLDRAYREWMETLL